MLGEITNLITKPLFQYSGLKSESDLHIFIGLYFLLTSIKNIQILLYPKKYGKYCKA